MAESGCLKGAHFENFEVMGNCAQLKVHGEHILTMGMTGQSSYGTTESVSDSVVTLSYPGKATDGESGKQTNWDGTTPQHIKLPEGTPGNKPILLHLQNSPGTGGNPLTFTCATGDTFHIGQHPQTTSSHVFVPGTSSVEGNNTLTYTPVAGNKNFIGGGSVFMFRWESNEQTFPEPTVQRWIMQVDAQYSAETDPGTALTGTLVFSTVP